MKNENKLKMENAQIIIFIEAGSCTYARHYQSLSHNVAIKRSTDLPHRHAGNEHLIHNNNIATLEHFYLCVF